MAVELDRIFARKRPGCPHDGDQDLIQVLVFDDKPAVRQAAVLNAAQFE